MSLNDMARNAAWQRMGGLRRAATVGRLFLEQLAALTPEDQDAVIQIIRNESALGARVAAALEATDERS